MDDQRSKAAAAFGKAFMNEARSNPALPKNSAVASQTKANARPIPTYAVGGVVVQKAPATSKPPKPAPTGPVRERRVVEGPGFRREPVAAGGGTRKVGQIDRRAAGGAGKQRKGQAEAPGRGPKLI